MDGYSFSIEELLLVHTKISDIASQKLMTVITDRQKPSPFYYFKE